MSDEITAVACHPANPLVSFACSNGNLHIWDYEMKILINLREFNSRKSGGSMTNAGGSDGKKTSDSISANGNNLTTENAGKSNNTSFLKPQCVAFEPTTGEFLAIGFSSGHIKFVNVETLEDVTSFAPSLDSILGITFSSNGLFLAAYDSSQHVILFKR